MRVAILGTRGIPANYGGFETFAEELSVRLAARGHEVTVYCRPHYVPREVTTYRGVTLVSLPTIRHKYLDTVVHTALSSLHAAIPGRKGLSASGSRTPALKGRAAGGRNGPAAPGRAAPEGVAASAPPKLVARPTRRRYDAILVCNAANAVFCWLPRLARTRVALNVDGIERKRKKWNALGRLWYLVSERLATWAPNEIVTDARVMQDYYEARYRCESTFIPYGCTVGRDAGTGTLEQFGLQHDEYVLYVSRLEPENNAHAVIAGFEKSKLNRKLVIVGDAPYAREYVASLRGLAGARVVFTGGVYGTGYRELQSHAFVYVHATEVGGTHPALVEAMGFGNCVVVNDTPENREVAADAGLYFTAARPETLTAVLDRLDDDRDLLLAQRAKAVARATATFSWEHVTDEYERLFERLVRGE